MLYWKSLAFSSQFSDRQQSQIKLCLEHEVNAQETWNCICNAMYYGFNILSSHASK